MAGIYIHVPFCKQACHYCDFHFSTNTDRMDLMVDMIGKELELRSDYLAGKTVNTIYFGGGTPSLLKHAHLEKILEVISSQFGSSWTEVTLEANPDDLKSSNLLAWKSIGINRLSIGIQSFNEKVLQFYNRVHTSEESLAAIKKARKAGFEKFSLDLIYGFPYPDHSLWKADLAQAIAQNPGHISSYALTIEPKTALGMWVKKGNFVPANDDFIAEQFEILQEEAQRAGYVQYEVSNFGKEGQFALHNTNYWKSTPYLGIGPSAHSFDGSNRGSNPANNTAYINAIQKGTVPFQEDTLTDNDRLNDYLLTGLRTIWGVDFRHIETEFGKDLLVEKQKILKQMDSAGWLIWKDNNLSLTTAGKLLADSIAAELFV